MAKPDVGGGGNPSRYESFDGPEVEVDINGLTAYYREMLDVQMDAAGPASMELSPMTLMIREGLTNPVDDGVNVFPEGAVAARLLQRRQSDFQHFMTDVLEGIRNIGSAAVVVAEIYEGTDNESAASVADIGFAFSDPQATGPAGFREAESWSQYEMRMAEQSGQMTMAMTGNDELAQVIRPANGVAIYLYPDGSSKQINILASDSSYESGTTTETTIYAPDHTRLQTTTETNGILYGGYPVESTTTTRGDERNGTTSTTTTITNHDGSMTLTNETTTTTTGDDGKTTTQTTTSDPVTVKPGDHTPTSSEAGPVEQAEERLDTFGGDSYVNAFGRGY